MIADLVPHKRALARLGLSRTSVWRAMHCGIADFPTPIVVRKRLYWKSEDVSRLGEGMQRYEGRCAFEARSRPLGERKRMEHARG